MQLMDFMGRNCGNFDGEAPEGYWVRPDSAPNSMPRLDFLDRVGPTRFAAVFAAMLADHALAFTVFRGIAAENIRIEESFPSLMALEQAGVVPVGTAIEIWS